MDDAWQSQDNAAAAISIPTDDVKMSNGEPPSAGDGQDWQGTRSPQEPTRRERSRSPGARGGGRERPGRGEVGGNPGNNLHVSGLTPRVENHDLELIFAKIGRVQKASVMYDPHSRESRGFAFVTMETAEEADAAIASLNSSEQWGKVITVEKARRGRARTPTPGKYFGPPKRGGFERPYDPRPHDSRYRGDDRDRRYRNDDGYRGGRHDDRSSRYDDRDRYDKREDRRGGGGGYDRERGGGYGGDRYEGGGRSYDDRRY